MKLHKGYVITANGTILVQIPDPGSAWGFYLADEGQSWPGGFGWDSWEPLYSDDDRITDEEREAMGWRLHESD